jgi:hypothetical protein
MEQDLVTSTAIQDADTSLESLLLCVAQSRFGAQANEVAGEALALLRKQKVPTQDVFKMLDVKDLDTLFDASQFVSFGCKALLRLSLHMVHDHSGIQMVRAPPTSMLQQDGSVSPPATLMLTDGPCRAPPTLQVQAPAEAGNQLAANRSVPSSSILQSAGAATSDADDRCKRALARSSAEYNRGSGSNVDCTVRELVVRLVDHSSSSSSSLCGDIEGWERRIRRRRFRDRLCRQAQEKCRPLDVSTRHGQPIRVPTFEAQAGSGSSDGATGSASWRSEDFSNSSGSWHSDDFCDPQAGPMVRHGMRLLVSQRSLQSNLLQKSDLTMSTGSIQEDTYSCTIESVADCSNSLKTSHDFQDILQWWPTDGA